LDTVKVRLQTQVVEPGKPPQFAGTVDCFNKTFSREGVSGLYKGAMSPLAGAMALNAGIFFAYGQSKLFLAEGKSRLNLDKKMTLYDYFICGALTGGFVAPIESPVDLLKCKLQAQVGKEGKYKGVWDCAVQLFRNHGIVGLYQGLCATVLRDIPAFGSYFFFYELTKQILAPEEKHPALWVNFLAGGAAGFGYWGLFYPLDIIKTRIQTDSINPLDRKYAGIWDCVKKTSKEGYSAFFKGYTPSLLRAIPLNAVIFVAVLFSKQQLFE